MNDERLPDAIIGRLSRVRTLESQLVDRLEEQEIRVARVSDLPSWSPRAPLMDADGREALTVAVKKPEIPPQLPRNATPSVQVARGRVRTHGATSWILSGEIEQVFWRARQDSSAPMPEIFASRLRKARTGWSRARSPDPGNQPC